MNHLAIVSVMTGFIHSGIKFAAALTSLGLASLHCSHQFNMQRSTASWPGDPMAPSHLTRAFTPLQPLHHHHPAQRHCPTQPTGTCVMKMVHVWVKILEIFK